MKCKKCNKVIQTAETNETDKSIERIVFEKHQKCIKCVYAEKAIEVKIKKCQVCGSVLPKSKWKYCNEYCADEGSKIVQKNYWLNSMKKDDKLSWHRFNDFKRIRRREFNKVNEITRHIEP